VIQQVDERAEKRYFSALRHFSTYLESFGAKLASIIRNGALLSLNRRADGRRIERFSSQR
jgi:hypothetical protein